jgi:protein O-GlcNAc transferase
VSAQALHPGAVTAARAARTPYDACPLCDHEDATDLGWADCSRHALYDPRLPRAMRWLSCDGCAHVFVDGYFDDAALAVLLAATHAGQTPGHDAARARGVSAAIVREVSRLRGGDGGRWLDVGFGNGALLTTADEFGYDVVGLDLRTSSVERMRAAGVEAHAVDLAVFAPTGGPFDVISMADVLEHMPFPRRALARAHTLLAEGGHLFLSMPTMDAAAWRALDAARQNPYWAEIEHLHNFGRRRLHALLRAHGFDPVRYDVSQRYVASMEIVARRT